MKKTALISGVFLAATATASFAKDKDLEKIYAAIPESTMTECQRTGNNCDLFQSEYKAKKADPKAVFQALSVPGIAVSSLPVKVKDAEYMTVKQAGGLLCAETIKDGSASYKCEFPIGKNRFIDDKAIYEALNVTSRPNKTMRGQICHNIQIKDVGGGLCKKVDKFYPDQSKTLYDCNL